MAQQQNHYLADLREIQFVLFEQCGLSELLTQAPFSGAFDQSGVDMVLDEAYQFATTVVGPLNGAADAEGCRIENGQVKTPAGFSEAWKRVYDSGLRLVSIETEWGGSGAPSLLGVAVEELISGANTAFGMYPGLAIGAAEVIAKFGTPEQKAFYLPKLYGGSCGGTMCLTEPQAGSDVGSARSQAVRQPDGRYLITGTKIFISGGDHDLADNIIHLVLARTENAPAGTKGLSLFIVPKHRFNADGSSGESNDVALGGIEHKMGIRASSTAVLNFGENGACVGEMVGGPKSEHQGMKQMFAMMNFARIGVGIQSLAVASAAYLNALRYAKERKQGSSIHKFKDPMAPRVSIIEHADVRRMLLDMKARVEGLRALIAKVSSHHDRAIVAQRAGDLAQVSYHLGQVELLTPLVKAYGSDQSFRICETAIQTMGGVGYTCDYGIEQYCRDAKIFSIYEGTNHIQAMDLIGRKLGMAGGANLQAYLSDVQTFVTAHSADPDLGKEVALLGEATTALQGSTMRLLSWFHGGQLELVPLYANRFLEMAAENTIAWLLLQQAVLAKQKLAALSEDHPDQAFYVGKLHAARYFARNVLPGVMDKADFLSREDKSPVEIPDAAFARM
jgi:alkylation response protein AidB-like acyl-CoA dehydrogenase